MLADVTSPIGLRSGDKTPLYSLQHISSENIKRIALQKAHQELQKYYHKAAETSLKRQWKNADIDVFHLWGSIYINGTAWLGHMQWWWHRTTASTHRADCL